MYCMQETLLRLIVFTNLLCAAFAVECEWENGPGRLAAYTLDNGDLTTLDIEQCEETCYNTTKYSCAAYNYKESTSECEHLNENQQTATVEVPVDDEWQHYIRPLCAGLWLPWKAEKGKSVDVSYTYNSSTTNTLGDCMTKCLITKSSDEGECRGIQVRVSTESLENNCLLLTKAAGDENVEVADSQDWQYFNRPKWYLESSVASTRAEIKYLGNIEQDLYIFTDVSIPVSGYLVAWQFYISGYKPCDTYASIWRPLEDDSFLMISNTKLYHNAYLNQDITFQLIQEEIVSVEQQDVLAVYSIKDNNCEHSLVSAAPNKGGPVSKINIDDETLSVNTVKQRSQFASSATPALKAYVSAYISIDEPPSTAHDSSLSHGEIWLKLPTPLTTEESAVITGYKVTCSGDEYRNDVVPCHEGVIAVGTREVRLSLADVTRTYHASLVLMRNINGKEFVEGTHSPISFAFCTERKKTDKVNIAEAVPPNVTVMFSHQFKESEECAKRVRFNYSGYDSGSKLLNGRILNFSLLLDSERTYDFRIYLELDDGAEILFWEKEYSLPNVAGNSKGKKNSATVAIAVVVPLVILALAVATLTMLKKRSSRSSQDASAVKSANIVVLATEDPEKLIDGGKAAEEVEKQAESNLKRGASNHSSVDSKKIKVKSKLKQSSKTKER